MLSELGDTEFLNWLDEIGVHDGAGISALGDLTSVDFGSPMLSPKHFHRELLRDAPFNSPLFPSASHVHSVSITSPMTENRDGGATKYREGGALASGQGTMKTAYPIVERSPINLVNYVPSPTQALGQIEGYCVRMLAQITEPRGRVTVKNVQAIMVACSALQILVSFARYAGPRLHSTATEMACALWVAILKVTGTRGAKVHAMLCALMAGLGQRLLAVATP